MQGVYSDILKSGIDISSLMKQNEDRESGVATAESDETIKNSAESARLISTKDEKSSEVINNANIPSSKEGNADGSGEKNQLLKELEATSKGTVKESVLWSYLKSANQPFTLFFLTVSILLTQIFASFADIWISYW